VIDYVIVDEEMADEITRLEIRDCIDSPSSDVEAENGKRGKERDGMRRCTEERGMREKKFLRED